VASYDPIVSNLAGGSGYRFTWPIEEVQITVKRLSDDRRNQTTSAELRIESVNPIDSGHVHQTRINLTSTQAKNGLIKKLTEHNDSIAWENIVEALCYQTLEMHRQGEPVQAVGMLPIPPAYSYRLYPIIPDGQAAMIYGPGGTFKSYLAMYISLIIQSGTNALGLRPTYCKALYLDWETSADVANERVAALCRGNNLPAMTLDYRYCYHPLSEDVEMLQDYIAENNIGFVVIDSAAPACGGDPKDADLTIRMFNALRALRVSSLILAHVAKPQNGDTRDTTPFGSVFFLNLARSVWEIKKEQNVRDSHLRCVLYHRKCNTGPLRSTLGYSVEITSDENEHTDSCTLTRLDDDEIAADPVLSTKMHIGERAYLILKGGKLTLPALADAMGLMTEDGSPDKGKIASLNTTLSRSKKFQKLGNEWGLAV
jgi:hypothetical protein